MVVDSLLVPQCIYRPGTFTGLMSLYESNYLRPASLPGTLRDLAGTRLSRVADDCDLRLNVTERSPYSTVSSGSPFR